VLEIAKNPGAARAKAAKALSIVQQKQLASMGLLGRHLKSQQTHFQ